MSNDKAKKSKSNFPWKEVLTPIAVIIAAYIGYLGVRSQIEIPIQATQTAEAKLTLAAQTANVPTPAKTMTMSPQKTTSSGYVIPAQKCAPACTYKDMTVGFIPTGSYESGWYAYNTASFKETAAQLGITLKVYDKQENVETQIATIRQLIQDPTVNVIVLDPYYLTGFDDVLKEAQTAGKLVVLEDRTIDSSSDLYYTRIGPDLVAEGQRGATAMCNLLANSSKRNVVEISGSDYADSDISRAKGFRDKMGNCGITITDTGIGNWDIATSKAVMAAFLKKRADIQGVFALNDEMAIGAIQAIKEAGLLPGKDIQVIGFDATAEGFQYLISGELSADIECNPMLAPQVYDAALKAMNGDTTMPEWVLSNEGEFFAAQGADALKAILATRKY